MSLLAEAPSILFKSGIFERHYDVHRMDRSLRAEIYVILFYLLNFEEKL